ncbi:carboxylate--amine ligase [Thermocladium modestius]|uniref:Carboxylate--amine ligase n=1 Tax=Thermocladium modestius TaxID=62609 RepID=A0A830GWU1_9CREN|nr:PAC2 family protein [Thermocladium modestius]GGP21682.1 carboxylate--amine ligase [Thermocladium modestius]
MPSIILNKPIFDVDFFITGFHGIGLVGYLAVRHLVTTMPCERIGFMGVAMPYTSYMKGILSSPGDIYNCPGNGITVALFNYGIPDRQLFSASRELAKWVIASGFKNVVLFGGLDVSLRDPRDELGVKVISTRRDVAENLLNDNYLVLGPLAIMMNEFASKSYPAMAILPYANPSLADPRAAATGLSYFSSKFNVKLDLAKLYEDAQALEEEIQKQMKQMEGRKDTSLYI